MKIRFNQLIRLIFTAHRSDDSTAGGGAKNFFLPRMTRGFFIRMTVVACLALVVFGVLLRPCVIQGGSMLPTYPEHGFTLCKRYAFWFTPPHRGDVVVVRFLDRVYFLKRVVAEAGDTVEFRKGVLYVNGRAQKEPYVRYVSDWELPPRVVKPHHVYVVGDNRSMNMESHHFGQVDLNRIIGAPL